MSRYTHRAAVASLLALALAGCGSTVQQRGTALDGVSGDGLSPGTTSSGAAATSSSTSLGGGSSALGGSTASRPGALSAGPAGSSTSTSTTTTSTTSPGSVGGSGAASSVPATGRGWDRKTVSIGITTTSDIQTVGNELNVHSINPGDLHADGQAMIGYLNAHGGLFGRTVKAEYYDVRTSDNGDTVGQAICEHFTRDVPVIGLLNMSTNGDTPAFDSCVAKAHLPTFGWFTDTGNNSYFDALKGYYLNMPFPSWSRVADPLIDSLVRQKYFTPWDTTAGGPGVAQPVKVGLLETDTQQGRQIAALLLAALKRVGHSPDPADVIYFSNQQDLSSSQVKFRADNVTHVLGDELLFLFVSTYESQHYRPRYGISSSNAPSLFLEGTSPAAQLVGSMGIGTTPTIDVFADRDPGPTAVPGMKVCDAIYKAASVSYPPDQRYAFTNEYGICDGTRLLAAAALHAGGFSGPQIRDALAQVGGTVPTALAFSNGLTPQDHGLPGSARDLYYETGCQCYRYRGPTFRL